MSNQPAIVYSNVWEDPELNRVSLQVQPGESVLSITSGGCNSLCLLLENPGRVVSIDFNPAQCYLLEFKKAAVTELEYDDFIEVLGVPFFRKPSPKPPEERLRLYERLKKHLSPAARDWWDANQAIITSGIFMCGKVEAFFALYRKLLGWLYDFREMEKLFEYPTLEEQRQAYKALKKRRWRFLNRILLNKTVLSLVKGAHSFAQVEDPNLSENLNKKIDRAMGAFYNPENYFMALMLLGGHHSPEFMSPYLLKRNWPTLKANIGKIEVFRGILTDVLKTYGPGSFDKLNLSNIFEWMTNDIFNGVIREAIALARPKARMAWRYTLARPRELDAENSRRLIREPELSEKLFRQDRAFIYESFHAFHLVD